MLGKRAEGRNRVGVISEMMVINRSNGELKQCAEHRTNLKLGQP